MNNYIRLTGCMALAALLAGLFNSAHGEWKNIKRAEGNNLGIVVSLRENPLYAGLYSVNEYSWQIPKGSGNMYGGGSNSYGPSGIFDLNGDGVCEDTMVFWDRGCSAKGGVSSLEAINLITTLAGSGEIMKDAVNRIENNRIWSSLDGEDLADWPAEFREGRTSSGAPVLHGAETIVGRYNDTFQTEYGVPLGASVEYSFYFLNFGESNNMMYGKMFLRNMSEFIKYNSEPAIANKVKASAPDGFVWKELAIAWADYEMAGPPNEGDEDAGWIFNPSLETVGKVDRSGRVESFSPQETPIFINKVLRYMSLNGETMRFIGHCPKLYTQYGVRHGIDVLETGRTKTVAYQWQLGEAQWPEGLMNPFTGRLAVCGIPGVIEPTDEVYNQWLFGWAPYNYSSCAVLHDFAPRDTASMDFVYAFVPVAPGEDYQMPDLDVANIGDEGMQQYLKPAERYIEVAELVHGGGYIVPNTPSPPPLTIVPGDRQVTISWSDVNLDQRDTYYDFLQENPELDPDGVYLEYDFEGFRLYRSFVGPTDSHSEPIDSCSVSQNNLHFHFVDRMVDDLGKQRMTNGMRVWYALVPYDKNYDPVTGDEMSLPSPLSGKVWNRPGSGLYSVIPRSNASNFKGAYMSGDAVFKPVAGTPVSTATTATLRGNGDGTLIDPPVYLQPVASFTVTPVLQERITSTRNVSIVMQPHNNWQPVFHDWGFLFNYFHFDVLENGSKVSESAPITARAWPPSEETMQVTHAELTLSSEIRNEGIDYAIEAEFTHLADGSFREELILNMDPGGYTGAQIWPDSYEDDDELPGLNPPNIPGLSRTGRFEITWKDGLTLEVKDLTHGNTLPFEEFADDGPGWGFVTVDAFGSQWTDPGQLTLDIYFGVPQAERTSKMVRTLPADNTQEFGIWVNGILWVFHGTDGVIDGMPAVGTVMYYDHVYGSWNGDMTELTQYTDPPFPGDSWELKIEPMSLVPDNADLSKIKVVPNPYLASSYLDLSPSSRRIEFINLPDRCTISIYTLSGNLVNVLNHIGSNRYGWGDYQDWDRLDANSQPRQFTGYDNHSGTEPWNLRNRFGQTVASGLYFYHVTDSRGESYTGKFYVVN